MSDGKKTWRAADFVRRNRRQRGYRLTPGSTRVRLVGRREDQGQRRSIAVWTRGGALPDGADISTARLTRGRLVTLDDRPEDQGRRRSTVWTRGDALSDGERLDRHRQLRRVASTVRIRLSAEADAVSPGRVRRSP